MININILDKINKQKNKVRLTLEDRSLAIGGMEGSGKTALLHELSNLLAEETGNDNCVLTCPLENGYSSYDNFRKYIPELCDYYNDKRKLRDNIIDDKPTHIMNYQHLKKFVQEMIDAKLQDPNFPVKIIAFDPVSVLEDYMLNDLLFRVYDETGLQTTINKYGQYGAIYTDASKEFKRDIVDPLLSVGYNLWFLFHIKIKKFNDKIYGEHDTYASKNSTSFFGNITTMVDYSLIFEDTMFTNNKKVDTKDGERLIRFRSGGNYQGAKARGTTIPETINVYGLDDKQIAHSIRDIVITELANKSGKSVEEFEKEEKVIRKQKEEEIVEKVNKVKEITETSKDISRKEGARVNFGNRVDKILKSLTGEALMSYENYFNSIINGKAKTIKEWVVIEDEKTLNDIIAQLNENFKDVDGFVLIDKI